jgi:hypothetical protein
MNRTSSVLTLHSRDKWSWIYVPALILFSSFAVNLIVGYSITSQEAFYTGGITSIFIYLFVAGIIVVTKTFPFAVGMSIRRFDYFIGTIAMGTIVSIAYTLLIFLMAQLENQLNGWGNSVHFFHFPYVNDGTFVEQLSLYMIFFLHLFFLGLLIGSYAKRFGGKGMLIASLAFVLISSVAVYLVSSYENWSSVFSWFAGQTAVQIAYWLIPFVLIYLVVSFLLLRRASV